MPSVITLSSVCGPVESVNRTAKPTCSPSGVPTSSAMRSATRPRGDPARLGVADEPGPAAARLERELGQLGRLARAGGARDDDDLVVADEPDELLAPAGDRQLLGVAQRRQGLVRRGEARGLAAGLLLDLLGAQPATTAATALGRACCAGARGRARTLTARPWPWRPSRRAAGLGRHGAGRASSPARGTVSGREPCRCRG